MKYKYEIMLVVIAVILIAFYVVDSMYWGPEATPEFVQCLNDKGAKFYGRSGCHFCDDQKKMFGDLMSEVNYIDCGINADECVEANITGVPTWYIDGEYVKGRQPLETLSTLTGCQMSN